MLEPDSSYPLEEHRAAAPSKPSQPGPHTGGLEPSPCRGFVCAVVMHLATGQSLRSVTAFAFILPCRVTGCAMPRHSRVGSSL